MKKKLITLLTCTSLMLGTVSSVMAKDKVVIKFAHVVAENTPKGRMAIRFKELVSERLGDKAVVKVYPNSQLFNDSTVLEAMLLGDVQLAAPSLSKFQKYTKKLQIFDLPFLFKDMAAVERFQQGPEGQALLNSMNKRGLKGLGYLHNGLKQLSANTPVKVPDDAKGKKFRIQTSNVIQSQFEQIDAVPLKKPFSEAFILLQTRAVDGLEYPWSGMFSQKFFEVQPYISETNHGLVDYMVVTSNEFWDSLDADLRSELNKAIKEAIAYGNEVAEEINVEARQKIIDSGRSEIVTLNDAERNLWVKAMLPVWSQFEDEIGADLIEAAKAANQ